MTSRFASFLTITVIRAATLAAVSSLAGCASSSAPGAGAGGSTGTGLGGAAGGALGGAGGNGAPDAGAAGGAGGGGTGGNGAGGGGGAGTGGAGALHGGSSARFICAAGATYGNPLTGIGTVMQIMQPNVAPIYSFSFIEGPVWIASLGKIFFSDNAASPAERIIQVTPAMLPPVASSFMENSGSNGLAIDNDDNLILADQRNQRIVRVSSTTATIIGTPLAASTTFKPNDVLVRSDNNIYVTDPASGFYRISPTGTLSAAMKQVNQPNGIALSLDERTLYVGDVGNQMIYTFALGTDGAVDTTSMHTFVMTVSGTVDGMCVDCAGNLYASTSNGVEVFSPAAARLGVVPTGESSNCTFGGPDRKTIYVTSRSLLKYVTLAVPGLPD
jgi:gluconolactonase